MSKIQVARTFYKRLAQNSLAIFAENVVKSCLNNPVYVEIQPLILQLQTETAEYSKALVAAESGAYGDLARKRLAQPRVVQALDKVAFAISYFGATENYAIGAGFKVVGARQRHSGVIPAPVLMRVQPTGNSGEALLLIQSNNPRAVQTYAVEFSNDGGATWANGFYGKGQKLLVTNLPSTTRVQFRVRSIGTHKRVSAWSAVVAQTVI